MKQKKTRRPWIAPFPDLHDRGCTRDVYLTSWFTRYISAMYLLMGNKQSALHDSVILL